MRIKFAILVTLLAILLAGCQEEKPHTPAETTGGSSAPTNEASPTGHDHTAAADRIAERFLVDEEPYAETTDYFIFYQEPDGCLTKVVDLGHSEQPLIIHDERIYYASGDAICAADFTGNVVVSISTGTRRNVTLLYSDDAFLYGSELQESGNASYLFQTNWELTEYQELPALPAKFRKLDYTLLEKELRETAGAGNADVFVHQASVQYDTNGMIQSLFLMIGFTQEGNPVQGNLMFSWWNQHTDYHVPLNPWFTPSDEDYGSTEDAIELSQLMTYLADIEAANFIPDKLPETERYYYLTYRYGAIEEIPDNAPFAPEADIQYMRLSNHQVLPVEAYEVLPEQCLVVTASCSDPSGEPTDSGAAPRRITGAIYIAIKDE